MHPAGDQAGECDQALSKIARLSRSTRIVLAECRKAFGWMNTVGLLRKLRQPGRGVGELEFHLHRGGLQPRAPAHAERVVTRSGPS